MALADKKSYPASEAKLHFGEILNRCVYGREPIIIKKHDRPVAVLVRIEDWQLEESQEIAKEPALITEIRQLHGAYQKKNRKKKGTKQPAKGHSAVEIIRDLRQEREEQLSRRQK